MSILKCGGTTIKTYKCIVECEWRYIISLLIIDVLLIFNVLFICHSFLLINKD
jgi:hypothetical protein